MKRLAMRSCLCKVMMLIVNKTVQEYLERLAGQCVSQGGSSSSQGGPSPESADPDFGT